MSGEKVDAELARLTTSLKLSAGEIDPNEAYGWERARERQNSAGSYRELERALEWMRDHHAIGWDFLMWIYGPLEPELSKRDREIEVFLVAAVAEQMPAQIKVPARLWRAHLDDLKPKIKELAHEATPEEIAETVALPLRQVKQILADLLAA